MKICIVSSSTRPERNSHRVALALQQAFTGAHFIVDLVDLKEEHMPLFSQRFTEMSDPERSLVELHERISVAGAFVFVTPEYNGGAAPALKNFIDTFAKGPFSGKPVGVATVSTGSMGGMRAAQQLQLQILAVMAYPQPQMLLTGEVTRHLDENGNSISDGYPKKLVAFVDSFSNFIRRFAGHQAVLQS